MVISTFYHLSAYLSIINHPLTYYVQTINRCTFFHVYTLQLCTQISGQALNKVTMDKPWTGQALLSIVLI